MASDDLRAAVLATANPADLEPLDPATRDLVRRALSVADELALKGPGLAYGAPAIVAARMTGRRFVLGDGFADEHTPPAEPGVYAQRVSDGWPWAWTVHRTIDLNGPFDETGLPGLGPIVENGPEPTDEDRARDLEAAGPPVRVGPAGPATDELVSEIARLADADPARVALPFRHLLTRAAHAWLTVRRVTRPGLATWARWGTFGARGLHPNDPYQPSPREVREGAKPLALWALSDAAAPRKDGSAGDEVASWLLADLEAGRDAAELAFNRWTDEAVLWLPRLAELWPDADAWAGSYGLSVGPVDVYGLALATVDAPGVGPVLAADGMLADLLAELGDEAAAREVRERSAARVARWLAPEPDLGLPGDPGAGPGDLWREWWGGMVPEGCPVASPAIVRVLRATWARFRPNVERGRRHLPAAPASAVQLVLNLHGAQRRSTYDDKGRSFVLYDLPPSSDLERVARFELPRGPSTTEGALRLTLQDETLRLSVYPYLLLHYVVMTLDARLSAGDVPWDAVPRLELPTGKALARAINAGESGKIAADVETAFHLLASLEATDGRGNMARLWGAPERRAHGGGRAAAWLVTPGELLRPTFVRTQPKDSRWRVLVYAPDVMPPTEWAGPTKAALVARLGLTLPMYWRDASGRNNGQSWIERPGIPLSGWSEWGQGLEQRRTLDELERGEWLTIDRGMVAPGPKLPRMSEALHEWAKRRIKD